MNAVELETELWNINNELVKAGIFPREYSTMADAVAELVRRYTAQQSVQADAATPSQASALCPHCGKPIMLVAPETPRR